MSEFTLSELAIVACAEVWRDDGEVLATGIGTIPRIAAGLARLTHNPALLMTDGEAYLIEEPLPLGPREEKAKFSGWMPYSRVFDVVWRGRRHALVTPTQVDRFGQGNISCIGDFAKPKVQMLGMRGFPGNSVSHANSMFIPGHNPRVFVAGEVDVVCSAGYNPARWPNGKVPASHDIRRIITDLCVMDFGGPERSIRVVSLHPGVTLDEVRAATGFPLDVSANLGETPSPTEEQLAIICRLDPHNLRATAIKNNPPGIRAR